MRTLSSILRFFLSLRYKVNIQGADLIKKKQAKFILPNHQATVDPQIMFTQILRFSSVVPVVSEEYFNIPVLKTIFKILGAVPVSDLSSGSRDQDVLKSVTSGVGKALKEGKNVILYPAGQIAGQGYEKIFNKQSAWAIVNELPENTQVIGVRISGLWGSMWSRAWVGKTPNFLKTALKAIFYVLANLIFFVPRRQVSIEFIDITAGACEKAKGGKNQFNAYLESVYNEKGGEHVLYLKHFFYAPTLKRELPLRIE